MPTFPVFPQFHNTFISSSWKRAGREKKFHSTQCVNIRCEKFYGNTAHQWKDIGMKTKHSWASYVFKCLHSTSLQMFNEDTCGMRDTSIENGLPNSDVSNYFPTCLWTVVFIWIYVTGVFKIKHYHHHYHYQIYRALHHNIYPLTPNQKMKALLHLPPTTFHNYKEAIFVNFQNKVVLSSFLQWNFHKWFIDVTSLLYNNSYRNANSAVTERVSLQKSKLSILYITASTKAKGLTWLKCIVYLQWEHIKQSKLQCETY
jgi:hypothetical protein